MRRVLLAAVLPLAACSMGSATAADRPASRDFPVTGFSGIDLEGSAEIDVRTGTGFSVRAEGDQAAIDRLEITRVGPVLKIDQRRSVMSNWTRSRAPKVFVTMPRLTQADIGGAGSIHVDRVEGNAVSASIGGSGSLTIDTLRVDAARVSIDGSGKVTASGTVGALDIGLGGSGSIRLEGVRANRARVDLSGSGSIRAAVDGPAMVSLSGSGSIDLGPAAKCQTRKSGSGRVRCG